MEIRLFAEGTIPEWTTPEWYEPRDSAPHLEQEGHRERLLLTEQFVLDALSRGAQNVIDLGAGDGGLLSLVKDDARVLDAYGYDLAPQNVLASANRGVNIKLRNIVDDLGWQEELPTNTVLVATEMLEHLIFPHEFARAMADSGAEWLVASSPYTENEQIHYEFHTWAWDTQGYRDLLENNGWSVIRQETSWISQVLLAVRK